MLRVATWNVNSVRVRLPQLLEWLSQDKPDVVLLQELKCQEEAFPAMEIENLGYNIAIHGQKTYNGVAILSKLPLDDICRGLPGNENDAEARYIEAVVSLKGRALRVASVYVPNGQTTDSDKFSYKLSFLDKLQAHLSSLLTFEEAIVVGGDYNIAPENIDVHDVKQWHGSVLTHDEVRKRFRRIKYDGYYDAYRLQEQAAGGYSWWDYRNNAYARDDGLRIDHLLLSPHAADVLTECRVARELRGAEKASDHAPVIGTFSL